MTDDQKEINHPTEASVNKMTRRQFGTLVFGATVGSIAAVTLGGILPRREINDPPKNLTDKELGTETGIQIDIINKSVKKYYDGSNDINSPMAAIADLVNFGLTYKDRTLDSISPNLNEIGTSYHVKVTKQLNDIKSREDVYGQIGIERGNKITSKTEDAYNAKMHVNIMRDPDRLGTGISTSVIFEYDDYPIPANLAQNLFKTLSTEKKWQKFNDKMVSLGADPKQQPQVGNVRYQREYSFYPSVAAIRQWLYLELDDDVTLSLGGVLAIAQNSATISSRHILIDKEKVASHVLPVQPEDFGSLWDSAHFSSPLDPVFGKNSIPSIS